VISRLDCGLPTTRFVDEDRWIWPQSKPAAAEAMQVGTGSFLGQLSTIMKSTLAEHNL